FESFQIDAAGDDLDRPPVNPQPLLANIGEQDCAGVLRQNDKPVGGSDETAFRRLRQAVKIALTVPATSVGILIGQKSADIEQQARAGSSLRQGTDGCGDVAPCVDHVDPTAAGESRHEPGPCDDIVERGWECGPFVVAQRVPEDTLILEPLPPCELL